MTHYHLIGIGGIGMSAIAHLLQQQNKTVTGSDLSSSSLTEKLKKLGVGVSLGHCKERVKKNYHVVYSSAINESNPEYEQAKKLNCHLLHRSEMLANIIQAFDCLAVTGSHGKTTTSALLTYVLQKANQSPSYALGGVIQNLDSHADIGKGRYFIIEADESDGSFINFHPLGAIITNMEYEHVEYYKSVGELHKSFDQFYQQVRNKNLLFWCKDKVAMPWIEGISYGFDSSCQLQIKDYEQFQWCSSFSIRYKGKCHNAIPINLIGKHNIYNAASVFGLCLELGIEPEVIKGAFKTFPGVKRRCQQHQDQQVVIINDYAHHPTEITTTLEALRTSFPSRRIRVIFQPHRFSRSKYLAREFAKSFNQADQIVVTDIFSAGEKRDHFNTQDLLNFFIKYTLIPYQYCCFEEIFTFFKREVQQRDIWVLLGAGSIGSLYDPFCSHLQTDEVKKRKISVACGGMSQEHHISLRSFQTISKALQEAGFLLSHFGVAKDGGWQSIDHLMSQLQNLKEIPPIKGSLTLGEDIIQSLQNSDVFFPVFHGKNGEDGTMQGLSSLLKIPCVGNFLANAICMDKAWTKSLVKSLGFKTAPWISLSKSQWINDEECTFKILESQFTYPCMVKAARLGSSLGVYKVKDYRELQDKIAEIFLIDNKVIIEKFIRGRELEFAVIGNHTPWVAGPGEIEKKETEVYDYRKKYAKDAYKTNPQVTLSKDLSQKGKNIAIEIYKELDLKCLCRLDFFLVEGGEFIFNEANPIPGFTETSLFPKIWEENSFSIPNLVEKIINDAWSQFYTNL